MAAHVSRGGFLLLAGLALSATPLLGQVVFEIETTEPSTGRSMTSSISVEGGNLRMEMQELGASRPGEIIFRGDRQEMLFIDHDRESYIVMDRSAVEGISSQLSDAMRQMEAAMANMPEEQRQMMEEMMRGRMPAAATQAPRIEVRATGERAEHAGYPTTRHEVLVNGERRQEMWVTDWNNLQGAAEARAAFESMGEFMQELISTLSSGPLGNLMNFEASGYERLGDLGGFAVVTRTFDSNDEVESETVLRSASRATLPAGHFDPPAGYELQEMPR